jgi:hypothetical protein
MKEIPYTVSLFIEIEEGLYEKFYNKLEKYYEELKGNSLSFEEKMDIKIQIKDVYKEAAQYVINVPKNIVIHLDSFYGDSEMKICPNSIVKGYYDKSTGFKLDTQLPQKTETGFY